jgi:hypothetical protein
MTFPKRSDWETESATNNSVGNVTGSSSLSLGVGCPCQESTAKPVRAIISVRTVLVPLKY